MITLARYIRVKFVLYRDFNVSICVQDRHRVTCGIRVM